MVYQFFDQKGYSGATKIATNKAKELHKPIIDKF